MNAHAERFNRTLQKQFGDYHEDLLFDYLTDIARKLTDRLLAYNAVLPHDSLARQSPIECWFTGNPNAEGRGPIHMLEYVISVCYPKQLLLSSPTRE